MRLKIPQGVVETTRKLRPEEQKVVLSELEGSVASMRFIAVSAFISFAALLFGAIQCFRSGSWFFGLVLAFLAALAVIPGVILLRRLWLIPNALPELTARVVRANCQSRLERHGKYEHTVYCVGSYRVSLRAGWSAFWPEGQEASLELYFPPDGVGVAWAGPIVVSLPGIDIPVWLRKPPPRDRGLVGVTGIGIGLIGLIVGAVAGAHHGWPVAGLAVAGAALMVWGGYRAWTGARQHDADVAAWIESIRRRS